MSYLAAVQVEFPCAVHQVFEALCDLSRYPQWNTGMTSISYTGRMRAGLEYTTTNTVMGRVNKATVKVMELVPDQAISLESRTGLVTFRAVFRFKELESEKCLLTCDLRFEFSQAVFNLARPVVEALAEIRLQDDLETLRSIL